MAKIHLRANKLTGENRARSICASKVVNGKVYNNSRATYRFMASEIVGLDEFKNLPENDRCAHCMEAGLIKRNTERRAKGLAPVSHLFEVTKAQVAR